MHVLLDQNVAELFRELGHAVLLVREILPVDSPDHLIAAVAELDGYVLVSHDKDFDTIAPRIPRGSRARFRRLSRITLDCANAQAVHRLRATMAFIELAFEAARLEGKPMRVVVQTTGIRVTT